MRSSTTNGGSFAGAQLCGTAGSGAVAGYYNDGTLNWKYAANNHQTFKTSDSITIGQMIYFGGAANPWTGLRMGVKVTGGNEQYPAGHWTALIIKVETAGKYDLTYNYQIRGDGAKAAEIYLLEGTYADNAAIEAAMSLCPSAFG